MPQDILETYENAYFNQALKEKMYEEFESRMRHINAELRDYLEIKIYIRIQEVRQSTDRGIVITTQVGHCYCLLNITNDD